MKNAWHRFRAWLSTLPPIMAPSVEFPIQAEVVDDNVDDADRELALFVITLPPGILSWIVMHMPFGETITREEAAATLLQREIRVNYRPMIIEVDRMV